MRIVDCILYSGESIALFRPAYLWDVVDEFVMVEAGETSNAALLDPFKAKITRLVMRNYAAMYLSQLGPA